MKCDLGTFILDHVPCLLIKYFENPFFLSSVSNCVNNFKEITNHCYFLGFPLLETVSLQKSSRLSLYSKLLLNSAHNDLNKAFKSFCKNNLCNNYYPSQFLAEVVAEYFIVVYKQCGSHERLLQSFRKQSDNS